MARRTSRMQVVLPDVAKQEISVLIKNADRLELISDLTAKQPFSAEPINLLNEISVKAEVSLPDLRMIINVFENINYMQKGDIGNDEVLARLEAGLSRDVARKFEDIKPLLTKAAALYTRDNPLALSFKAEKIIYDRERLYRDATIYTDIRPIFDSSGEKVLEWVVTHELALTWVTSSKSERAHYALDNADLVALRSACDRALLKSTSLKTQMGEGQPVLVLQGNEEQS